MSLAVVSIPTVDAEAATCPSGAICVFQNADWSGGKYTWYPPKQNSDLGSPAIKFSNGVTVNNRISSFISNSSNYVTFCTGTFTSVGDSCDVYNPHEDVAHVAHNDAYTSFSS